MSCFSTCVSREETVHNVYLVPGLFTSGVYNSDLPSGWHGKDEDTSIIHYPPVFSRIRTTVSSNETNSYRVQSERL